MTVQIEISANLSGQGTMMNSVECLEQAVRLNPSHAGAWFQLGTVCEETGNEDRAIEAFQTAAKLNPDFAPAHESLGLLLYARGDMKGAKKSFKELSRIADMGRPQPKMSPVVIMNSLVALVVACASAVARVQ